MRVLHRRVIKKPEAPAAVLAALLLGTAMVPGAAEAQPLPRFLKFNYRYEKARPLLLRAGWHPRGEALRKGDSCNANRDERCVKFQEAQSCDLVGLQQCHMIWAHNDGTVMLVVAAEEKKVFRVKAVSQQ